VLQLPEDSQLQRKEKVGKKACPGRTKKDIVTFSAPILIITIKDLWNKKMMMRRSIICIYFICITNTILEN
jgi:hypothetical protein